MELSTPGVSDLISSNGFKMIPKYFHLAHSSTKKDDGSLKQYKIYLVTTYPVKHARTL
jgi:hypothetical protein